MDYKRDESALGYFGAISDGMRRWMAEGDVKGAHAEWLWYMNEAGKCYRDKVSDGHNSHAADVVQSVLCTIGNLIPNVSENRPAHAMIDALVELVVEAPTGKREHPLFNHSGWPGTTDKGSLRQQKIVGQSLACLALLEHFKHPRRASAIADALNKADYPTTAATVRDWKRRKLKVWPIAYGAYADGMNNLPRVISEYGITDAVSAESFVRTALKLAVAT